MSEAVGAAVIRMGVDADGIDAGVASIKGKVGSLADIAARANETVSKSTERLVNRLELQNATLNMSTREAKLYELGLKGVGKAQLAHVDGLMKSIEAANKTTNAFDKTGISAKQTAAAMRGVPAQFTDIFTSLQGGQAPLTVLFQQGGQLKDMFGGVGNAARAMGGYVAGMITPVTLAVGAIATLGIAAYKGSKEQDEFARALILTGNASGTTAGQMAGMARSISQSGTSTQSAAAAAIAAFASEGSASAQNLEKFATVAIKLEKEAGVAVADTVKQFAELGKDPLGASLKLNESTRHLTMEQYSLIRALTEQGKTAQAAKVAQEAYFNVMNGRTGELQANLGNLETIWRNMGEVAGWAWDKMLGLGREDTVEQKIASLQERIKAAQNQLFASQDKKDADSQPFKDQITLIQKAAGHQATLADNAKKAADAVQAKSKWDADGVQYLTKELTLKREIERIQAQGKKAGASEADIAARVSAARRKTNGDGFDDGIAKARMALELAQIQSGLNKELNAYSNHGKELEALRSQKGISDSDYYAAKLALLELTGGAEEKALSDEIARAQKITFTGNNKTQQELENGKKIIELQDKLAIARANNATAIGLNAGEAIAANRKIEQSYNDLAKAAQRSLEATQRGYARQLAGVGKGTEERAKIDKLGGLDEARTTAQNTANDKRDVNSGKFDASYTEAQYQHDLKQAQDTYQGQADAYLQSVEAMKAANSDWSNGYSDAWANILTESQNSAKAMEELTKNAFSGMKSGIGDAFADAIVDGKNLEDSLKSVFRNVAKQAISSFIQMQISNLLVNKAMLASKVATDQAGAASGIGAKTAETTTNVGLAAIEGAANAFKAMAGIPFVGPVLAVASAAAAMSFVMGLLGGGGSKGGNSVTTVNKNPYPTNTAVPVAGQRALGGSVSAGGLYEVNERGTEMFTTGGRDYLMVGQQGGFVTPNNQLQGGGQNAYNGVQAATTNIEITVQKLPDGYNRISTNDLGKLLRQGKRDNVKGFENV